MNYGTMKSNYGTVGRGTMKPGDTSSLAKNKKIKDQVHNKLVKLADAKYRHYEKKIFTDDKIQWLNSSETLRQQGVIDVTMPVVLRRKFFYSDANVETHDPVQLNLLYEQCRDSIIKEEYPVTVAEARFLAGLQDRSIHHFKYAFILYEKGINYSEPIGHNANFDPQVGNDCSWLL